MVVAPGLLMLAVFLLGWLLFLRESHRALQHGETSADDLRLVHERKAQAARQLQPATEALADLQRQLLDARWRLSAGEDMSDLLDGLASSGHALGLVFEQLDVLPEGAGLGYRVVPLEIQVIGTYPALRSWLQAWLDQVRLLRPTRLELTSVQGRPGVRRLSLQVESYHPAEALAAPASLAHEPRGLLPSLPAWICSRRGRCKSHLEAWPGLRLHRWKWWGACRAMGETRRCSRLRVAFTGWARVTGWAGTRALSWR
ncbi:type 4a pilus biogenesis protein PilO [Pseudomonas putida]|uniref:type 4a pilus biogenesis protein PilO n=1 Tax=Pseudomonas putida TaxID=303 RepID=UPI002D1F71F9|nr:type 4a pilus biogenesis protein PilO [Pseudomonas putida]MEB3899673.1 type 4a pilus biogenesis protein PilO [Pseudomonas putida]